MFPMLSHLPVVFCNYFVQKPMMFRSICLDEICRCPVLYSQKDHLVTCRHCGQTHNVKHFTQTAPLDSANLEIQSLLKILIVNVSQIPKKGPETIKVQGISNYHHKLISPLLSHYGMDKQTGKARPLSDLIGRPVLDCSIFGDRTFCIEKRHLDVAGFGRDQTGSAEYLSETLKILLPYNDHKETLVPLHVDGDGHCLVHAVSRALVGRELFWHPLRVGLKQHFITNIEKYKDLLADFINGSEWPCIIEECDPDYLPLDGDIIGLRNIHILGLAHLLHRPILLLDSIAGMETSADYAAVFLPGLSSPASCMNKNGQLNPPLCLAWSSSARNHFIPLVPIKEGALPRFPKHLLPKVWGFPQSMLQWYIIFDEDNCLTIGGENSVSTIYLQKLTSAMDELFTQKYDAPPQLVVDVYHYYYSRKTGVKPLTVVETTASALQDRRLLRCLLCDAVCMLPFSGKWLGRNGVLYTLAQKQYGFLRENTKYPLYDFGVSCTYDAKKDRLVLDSSVNMEECSFCHGAKLRMIRSDGSIAYENLDTTTTPVTSPETNYCRCGYKHWWKGQEYDNPPQEIPVVLVWNGRTVNDVVQWFQYESQPHLNSNVYQVASYLLQKHFPGEFGSERLHQNIVDQILEQTKSLLPPTQSPTQLALDKEEASGGLNEEIITPSWLPVKSAGAEPSCSGPIPKQRSLKKSTPKSLESLRPPIKKSSTTGIQSKGTIRVGPGFTMLSHTPAEQNSEAMTKFLQLLNKNPTSSGKPSPEPSTSKQILPP